MVMIAAIRSVRSAELAVAGTVDDLMFGSNVAGQRSNYFGQITGESGDGLGPDLLFSATTDVVLEAISPFLAS